MFAKIENIVKALGLDMVDFKIRRSEMLENVQSLKELHEKHGVSYRISQGFSTSSGRLELDAFISFIKEYDKLLDLTTTLIDLESVVINPLFL